VRSWFTWRVVQISFFFLSWPFSDYPLTTIESIRKSQKSKTLSNAWSVGLNWMFPDRGKVMELTTNSRKHFRDSKTQKNSKYYDSLDNANHSKLPEFRNWWILQTTDITNCVNWNVAKIEPIVEVWDKLDELEICVMGRIDGHSIEKSTEIVPI